MKTDMIKNTMIKGGITGLFATVVIGVGAGKIDALPQNIVNMAEWVGLIGVPLTAIMMVIGMAMPSAEDSQRIRYKNMDDKVEKVTRLIRR